MRLGASRSGELEVIRLCGSLSWTSKAAARILLSFNAAANAASSIRLPRAVLTRKAPENLKITVKTVKFV